MVRVKAFTLHYAERNAGQIREPRYIAPNVGPHADTYRIFMAGIANLSTTEFQRKIAAFRPQYIADWNKWLAAPIPSRAEQLGNILRGWQACRPNRMRRTRTEDKHGPPYIEDLLRGAEDHLQKLGSFDIRTEVSFTAQACGAFEKLWAIFEQLSYGASARAGLAGVVGISKAVLLLSAGRVGPAFDSTVRRNLGIVQIGTPAEWVQALRVVSADISAFERLNNITLQEAAPDFAHLHAGRIYDMAMGPGET